MYYDKNVGVRKTMCTMEVREGVTYFHLFNMIFSAAWAIFLFTYYQFNEFNQTAEDIYGVA